MIYASVGRMQTAFLARETEAPAVRFILDRAREA